MTASLENLRVVLVTPRNPLNIGAAARALANFGATTLRLVNPHDPGFRTAPSAVGAEEILARAEVFPALAEAVADCSLVVGTTAAARRSPTQPLHPLPQAAAALQAALTTAPAALLFGSEKHGLTNQDLTHCHWLLHIPTAPGQPSMNLGQAVAVCLYELVRTAAPPSTATHPDPANAAQLERLTSALLEALELSGYTLPDQTALTEQNTRRLIRRLNPIEADSELLQGMLRQILWKLRS